MKPANQGCMRPMALAALLLCLIGCNIQWIPVNPVQVDPNPPGPVIATEFRLLIIEETADRPSLPPGQLSIITSTTFRQYLDATCAKLPDGSNGYRIVDKDQIDKLPKPFRAVASAQRNETPWLYVTNGTTGLSCPLPASVDELLAKIKPYAEGQ